MKKAYPVIFTQADDVFLIEVPDLDIVTEGENKENAIEMAKDAISLTIVTMEDEKILVPDASAMEGVDITKGTFADKGKSVVSMVEVDTEAYRDELNTSA